MVRTTSIAIMRGLFFIVLVSALVHSQLPSGAFGDPQEQPQQQPSWPSSQQESQQVHQQPQSQQQPQFQAQPREQQEREQNQQPEQNEKRPHEQSQDLLDKPNPSSNKSPSQEATPRISNQSKAFEQEAAPQNKTEDGLMDKMKSLASQAKEKLASEDKDSHTIYQNPESVGMTSRRPEIFDKMARSAALGRKEARENHGSNGTDASFVRASEIGAVERIQQILVKTQEHMRNNAQKVDEKISEFTKKMKDSIFKSS